MISPEPFIEKCRSLAGSKDLHLEVVDGRVHLAWTNGCTTDIMERVDIIGLGISYDMLRDALSDAGGTVDADGRYPINEVIKQRLRKLLKTKWL